MIVLMSCTDIISFDDAVDKVRQAELTNAPAEFREYFEKRIVTLLRANVIVGKNKWTNNNCESVNHVLKQYTQWKPQQLPELVDKISELITSQNIEANRAMVVRGDFVLQPTHAKHQLTIDVWKSMSDVQRQRASDACFRLPGVPSATSKDGSLTVPVTPGAGKKPNQRKRAKAVRTRSATGCAFKKLKTTNLPASDSEFSD